MKDEDFKKKLEQLVDDLDHKVCGDDCNVCVFKANGFNICYIAEFQDCLSKYEESKDE